MPSTAHTAIVYPTPPPTTNDLGRSQRTRLLKSSRKLEALLGATPYVLEVDVSRGGFLDLDLDPCSSSSTSVDTIPRPPITPRTKASRRRGRLFESSSDSSYSSSSEDDGEHGNAITITDDSASEASFVFVPSTTPKSTYQAHSLPAAVASPISPPKSRKRSKSEAKPKPKYNKAKPLPQPPTVPIHVDLPLSAATKTIRSSSKTRGPQPLSQPILLRLRSVPVRPAGPRPSRSPNPSPTHVKSASLSTITSLGLRSPLSSVFNVAAPATPEDKEAREREIRRKKLAKLTRTLGENVPPELVFAGGLGSRSTAALSLSPPTSPIDPASPRAARKQSISRPRRKTSVSGAAMRRSPSKSRAPPSSSSSAKPKAASAPCTPEKEKPKPKRGHRPRSLSAPLLFAACSPTSATFNPTPSPSTTLEDAPTPTHAQAQAQVRVEAPIPPPTQSAPAVMHAKSHSAFASGGYYAAQEKATALTYRPRRRGGSSLDSPRGRTAFESLATLPPLPYTPAYASSSSASSSTSNLVLPYGGNSSTNPYARRAFGSGSSGNYPARGASSLDIDRSAMAVHQSYRSPVDYVWGGKRGAAQGDEQMEWGRRKEKEWSGEWNVKDMGDVVKKLRELKGR